jgi:hypothetical protein
MPTFAKFEGDRTKYRKWKMEEILAAARLTSTDEYGLMPFALSAAHVSGVRFSLLHTYHILKQHVLHSYYILIHTLLHTTTFNRDFIN